MNIFCQMEIFRDMTYATPMIRRRSLVTVFTKSEPCISMVETAFARGGSAIEKRTALLTIFYSRIRLDENLSYRLFAHNIHHNTL